MFENIKETQARSQIEAGRQRIERLQKDVDRLNAVQIQEIEALPGDWTHVYRKWDEWEDIEGLHESLTNEKEMVMSLSERPSYMNHRHEHSEERRIFELPEPEKLKECEQHRLLGNYLFREGLYPKAAEQYQVAMSLYEYCFPDTDEDQEALNAIRRTCTCNISLCYQRMGMLRLAVEAATQVIKEEPSHVKAHFRRAQAYRLLDEYEHAELDLSTACRLAPMDKSAMYEMTLLRKQRRNAIQREKEIAKNMLGTKKIETETDTGVESGNDSKDANIRRKEKEYRSENIILTAGNLAIPLEPLA